MCQYITLLTYEFVNSPIIPLDYTKYGADMTSYLADLQDTIDEANAESDSPVDLNLAELVTAIETFNASAEALTAYIASADMSSDDIVTTINSKIRDYQRGFATAEGGLPGRDFFQNVVQAPGLDTGYAPVTWPGITEAITEYANWTMAEEWVGKSARAVQRAAAILAP
jgi:N-acetylated-alpha-linked acidic dipeptidase